MGPRRISACLLRQGLDASGLPALVDTQPYPARVSGRARVHAALLPVLSGSA